MVIQVFNSKLGITKQMYITEKAKDVSRLHINNMLCITMPFTFISIPARSQTT